MKPEAVIALLVLNTALQSGVVIPFLLHIFKTLTNVDRRVTSMEAKYNK